MDITIISYQVTEWNVMSFSMFSIYKRKAFIFHHLAAKVQASVQKKIELRKVYVMHLRKSRWRSGILITLNPGKSRHKKNNNKWTNEEFINKQTQFHYLSTTPNQKNKSKLRSRSSYSYIQYIGKTNKNKNNVSKIELLVTWLTCPVHFSPGLSAPGPKKFENSCSQPPTAGGLPGEVGIRETGGHSKEHVPWHTEHMRRADYEQVGSISRRVLDEAQSVGLKKLEPRLISLSILHQFCSQSSNHNATALGIVHTLFSVKNNKNSSAASSTITNKVYKLWKEISKVIQYMGAFFSSWACVVYRIIFYWFINLLYI